MMVDELCAKFSGSAKKINKRKTDTLVSLSVDSLNEIFTEFLTEYSPIKLIPDLAGSKNDIDPDLISYIEDLLDVPVGPQVVDVKVEVEFEEDEPCLIFDITPYYSYLTLLFSLGHKFLEDSGYEMEPDTNYTHPFMDPSCYFENLIDYYKIDSYEEVQNYYKNNGGTSSELKLLSVMLCDILGVEPMDIAFNSFKFSGGVVLIEFSVKDIVLNRLI